MKDFNAQKEAIRRQVKHDGYEETNRKLQEMQAICGIDLSDFSSEQENIFHQFCRDYMQVNYPHTWLSMEDLEGQVYTAFEDLFAE